MWYGHKTRWEVVPGEVADHPWVNNQRPPAWCPGSLCSGDAGCGWPREPYEGLLGYGRKGINLHHISGLVNDKFAVRLAGVAQEAQDGKLYATLVGHARVGQFGGDLERIGAWPSFLPSCCAAVFAAHEVVIEHRRATPHGPFNAKGRTCSYAGPWQPGQGRRAAVERRTANSASAESLSHRLHKEFDNLGRER